MLLLQKISKKVAIRFTGVIITVIISAFICVSFFMSITHADSNLGPSSYELKFVLDPDMVLDENHQLKDKYKNDFAFKDDNYSTNEVMYLETTNQDFINNDWINRIRQEGNEETIERTYKKRYPLSDTKLTTIQDEIADAQKNDGFNDPKDLKKTEVDWGYSKMALSFSLEEDAKDPSPYPSKLADYTSQQAVAFAADAMPIQEKNCNYSGWGLETIKKAGIAGPLKYQKYEKGRVYETEADYESISGDDVTKRKTAIKEKIKIEIWPVPNTLTGHNEDYIVELSFKLEPKKNDSAQDVYDKAAHERDIVNSQLKNMGILIEADSLKTSATLAAYPPKFSPETRETQESQSTDGNLGSSGAGTNYRDSLSLFKETLIKAFPARKSRREAPSYAIFCAYL